MSTTLIVSPKFLGEECLWSGPNLKLFGKRNVEEQKQKMQESSTNDFYNSTIIQRSLGQKHCSFDLQEKENQKKKPVKYMNY